MFSDEKTKKGEITIQYDFNDEKVIIKDSIDGINKKRGQNVKFLYINFENINKAPKPIAPSELNTKSEEELIPNETKKANKHDHANNLEIETSDYKKIGDDVEEEECDEIDLCIPIYPKIHIKKCKKMKLSDIIDILNHEGFYYSEQSKSHLQIFINGKDKTQDQYPFNKITKQNKVELKMNEHIVTLKYSNKKFIFLQYEPISVATQLIKKVYPDCKSIQIFEGYNRLKQEHEKLYRSLKYEVILHFSILIKSISNNFKFTINSTDFNYLPKISDLKKQLAKEYQTYLKRNIEPNSIEIYDKNK